MPSNLRRRSGNAVASFCEQMEWQPDYVFQVGIGQRYDEVGVFQEQWPDVKFVGCEPSPSILKQINPTAGVSRLGAYPGLVVPYAIGRNNEIIDLYTKSKHKDGCSVFRHLNNNPRNVYKSLEVECRTLDWVLKHYGLFGSNMLLWLDCEGSEYNALLGGPVLLNSVSVINVEMSGKPQGDGWCNPQQVHKLLHKAGFAQAWCHTNRIHARQYDAIYVRQDMLKPDLCMCLQELNSDPFEDVSAWEND